MDDREKLDKVYEEIQKVRKFAGDNLPASTGLTIVQKLEDIKKIIKDR